MALESFPPCMRRIQNELRAEHHLKYFARQQYGLFLKGAGMPLDESIRFFRDEFTKQMDVEKVGNCRICFLLLLHTLQSVFLFCFFSSRKLTSIIFGICTGKRAIELIISRQAARISF